MDDNMMKKVCLVLVVISLTACSSISRMFPDNSAEYRSAEMLPNLELPPDLTATSANNTMDIPGGRSQVSLADQTASEAIRWAEIRTLDDDRSLLVIPEELGSAWTAVENALQAGEIEINSKDQVSGTMNVTFKTGEEQGWFSRLAFWRSDSHPFMIRLTAADANTELTVLEQDGEWAAGLEAELLMTSIRTRYNSGRSQ